MGWRRVGGEITYTRNTALLVLLVNVSTGGAKAPGKCQAVSQRLRGWWMPGDPGSARGAGLDP